MLIINNVIDLYLVERNHHLNLSNHLITKNYNKSKNYLIKNIFFDYFFLDLTILTAHSNNNIGLQFFRFEKNYAYSSLS